MADFDSSDYLSSTSNTAYDPGVDTSKDYGDTGSWLNTALSGVRSLLGGTSSLGQLGSLLGFGGASAALRATPLGFTPAPKVGFQGSFEATPAQISQRPYVSGQTNDLLRLRQAAQDAMRTGATQAQVQDAALRTYGISPNTFTSAMGTEGEYRRPGQDARAYFNYATAPAQMRTEGRPAIPTPPPPVSAFGAPKVQAMRAPVPSVPEIGTPERAAFEQRLRADIGDEAFKTLQANPNSVLSPTFGKALAANLAGKQALQNLGLSSVFGSEFTGGTAADAGNFLRALEIERPVGGHITENNDLDALLEEYISNIRGDNPTQAAAAMSRANQLGVNATNFHSLVNALAPGLSSEAYAKYYDPESAYAKANSGRGLPGSLSTWFEGQSSGWAGVAVEKARHGYTDEQIAYALGRPISDVQAGLAPFEKNAYAAGGIASLGAGRYLRGPGDGVSDDINAEFTHSGEPAKLADGEFVLPARVVAEIGNGSSAAGARKLYAMMDRVEAMAKRAKRGEPSGADAELHKLA